MAIDATMLDIAGLREIACWRMYGWNEPAITFGYSQSWEWIRQQTGNFTGNCVRRVTGGGIVDHRQDLTYSLVIPHNHALYRTPAIRIYQSLHQRIADIFLAAGIPSELAPCTKKCTGNSSGDLSGICFQQPAPYDVVASQSGKKLAGAAMKRNQSGILIQGSLSKLDLPGISAEVLEQKFGSALAHWLDAARCAFRGALPEANLSRHRERFGSRQWNRKR